MDAYVHAFLTTNWRSLTIVYTLILIYKVRKLDLFVKKYLVDRLLVYLYAVYALQITWISQNCDFTLLYLYYDIWILLASLSKPSIICEDLRAISPKDRRLFIDWVHRLKNSDVVEIILSIISVVNRTFVQITHFVQNIY